MTSHLRSSILLAITLTLAPAPASAQDRAIPVKSARPIMEVLRQLQSSFGWVVAYEEPRYQFHGDIEDVSEEVRTRRGLNHKVDGFFAHRATTLPFTIPDSTAEQPPSEIQTLQALVSAYNRGEGEEYELRNQGNSFSIVGVGAKDQVGRFQRQVPVLDTVIELAEAERDGNAVLRDVCKALTKTTGIQVSYGPLPSNVLSRLQFSRSFSGRARDIVTQVLNDPGVERSSSWLLLYSPSDGSYGLGVQSAPQIAAPSSGTVSSPERKLSPNKSKRFTIIPKL